MLKAHYWRHSDHPYGGAQISDLSAEDTVREWVTYFGAQLHPLKQAILIERIIAGERHTVGGWDVWIEEEKD